MKAQENWTRHEVAEFLRVSPWCIGQWTRKGQLKAYRIGRRLLYRADEVRAALKEGQVRGK